MSCLSSFVKKKPTVSVIVLEGEIGRKKALSFSSFIPAAESEGPAASRLASDQNKWFILAEQIFSELSNISNCRYDEVKDAVETEMKEKMN